MGPASLRMNAAVTMLTMSEMRRAGYTTCRYRIDIVDNIDSVDIIHHLGA